MAPRYRGHLPHDWTNGSYALTTRIPGGNRRSNRRSTLQFSVQVHVCYERRVTRDHIIVVVRSEHLYPQALFLSLYIVHGDEQAILKLYTLLVVHVQQDK